VLDGFVSRRPDRDFIDEMRALEPAYLQHSDAINRSGFGGGPERWEAERRPLIGAIDRSGTFLDVGCANGWLASCVRGWCSGAGFEIEPFGADIGPELAAEAREILSAAWVADAWSWEPPRRFTFVYSIIDLAPADLVGDWLTRLASWVELGGRLIVGSYGSVSRRIAPTDVASAIDEVGLSVVGEASGGEGPVTRFAWGQL